MSAAQYLRLGGGAWATARDGSGTVPGPRYGPASAGVFWASCVCRQAGARGVVGGMVRQLACAHAVGWVQAAAACGAGGAPLAT